jgi:membrane protein YqaA with SNARE-associated domain
VSQVSDIEAYARRSLLFALALLLLLFAAVAAASLLYGPELTEAARFINDQVGLGGLMAILFVSDLFASPVPPDMVLVVISQTPHHTHWPVLVGVIGVQSVIAGNLAWAIAKRLGSARVLRLMPKRFRRRSTPLVNRYGALAVALGALTPVPFSLVCWAAGALKMPYTRFFLSSLLRVPRFYLYYITIAGADGVLRGLS